MYAIVRAGGHQHRVSVDDTITVDRRPDMPGTEVSLPVVLLVDDGAVTSDPAALGRMAVSARVVGHGKGAKINALTYRNKTGYRRRFGHRQRLTELRITGIDAGK
jgi:large subunit ribosomal protein L21